MIETFVTAHNLDRKRIFITGLSAGGAMAAVMLATYPEIFMAGAIIAGLPYGIANTMPQAFDRMRGQGGPSEQILQQHLRDASGHTGTWPRISIWQGSADQTVVPSNAEAIAAQWRGVHQFEKVRSEVESIHVRWSWCNAAGEVLIEMNTINSMGHGTPLGDDGLGAPGPYMLDVGISSTREIAQFWVIEGSARAASTMAVTGHRKIRPASQTAVNDTRWAAMTTAVAADAATEYPASPRPQGSSVSKIIEDSLRAAGLMR